MDRILIETDSPAVYQGRKSEPADLVVTLQELSRIKGVPPDEVARITAANTKRFCGLYADSQNAESKRPDGGR